MSSEREDKMIRWNEDNGCELEKTWNTTGREENLLICLDLKCLNQNFF
jgi:hypothetical protein